MSTDKKDWVGDSKSIYVTLGASNHTEKEREQHDYYATDPVSIDKLVKHFQLPNKIWECACGEGHLSKRLKELGHVVYSSDLVDRGFSDYQFDFLVGNKIPSEFSDYECILTNPPYKYASEFIHKSLSRLKDGQYCIMLLKTTFLEGKKRYDELFSKTPPKYIYQFVRRLLCAKNGEFDKMIAGGGSAVSYAWFVWERGYEGDTIVKWLT